MPDRTQKTKEVFLPLLSKTGATTKNQLHAFEYRVNPNPIAVKALQDVR
ncbi:MAG: hypothetical protein IPL27_16380 [Lewinellaceae bacterium]|nr:hypothetical protein [Lewinellaceae bacterium]